MSDERAIREVIDRIGNAWRLKQFEGLDECFHEDAVIVGPGYVEFGRGRQACADSYREFAANAQVLEYSESSHCLRIWGKTAVFTCAWEMTYQREGGPIRESGTDQLVLGHTADGWQVVWRYMFYQPQQPG